MTKKEIENKTLGFTLVEMSIVLVIIGLIVGGILVGRDMINAAQIRATVAQTEKYNSAVNTFKTKYNDLPGDIVATKCTQFGLFAETTLSGTPGHEDGNGQIEGGTANATVAVGETIDFWEHLYAANLINNISGVVGNSQIINTTGALSATVVQVNQTLPPTRTSPPNYFAVYAAGGLNYFQVVPVAQIVSPGGAYTFGTFGLTPVQAFNIDIKLDDGTPETGIVQAAAITGVLNAPPSVAAAPTNNICVTGTVSATDTYNRTLNVGSEDGSCSVRFRFN